MTDDEQTRAARLLEIEALLQAVADQQAMPDDSWIEKWNLLKDGLLAELTAAEAERDRLRERISDLELTLKLTLAGEDD